MQHQPGLVALAEHPTVDVVVGTRLDEARPADERVTERLGEVALREPVGPLGSPLADEQEGADLLGVVSHAGDDVPGVAEVVQLRGPGLAALAELLVVPVPLPRRDDGATGPVLVDELRGPHLPLLGPGPEAGRVGEAPGAVQGRRCPHEQAVVPRSGGAEPRDPRGSGGDVERSAVDPEAVDIGVPHPHPAQLLVARPQLEGQDEGVVVARPQVGADVGDPVRTRLGPVGRVVPRRGRHLRLSRGRRREGGVGDPGRQRGRSHHTGRPCDQRSPSDMEPVLATTHSTQPPVRAGRR